MKDYAEEADIFEVIRRFYAGEELSIEVEKHNYKNYGHFLQVINRADNMAWDCFVPGYSQGLPQGVEFDVVDIYTVLTLKNGNHKICVAVDFREPDIDVWKDISAFKASYENRTGKKMRYLSKERHQ